MDFSDIAIAFGRPTITALMGPAPLTAQTAVLGRSTATHTVRTHSFRQTLARISHRASARPDAGMAQPPRVLPTAPQASYSVRAGDTLSAIVRRTLDARLGPGESPTEQEVYRGVARVAAQNRLENPDFILPGQTLNLAPLDDGVGGPAPAQERALAEILAEVFGEKHETHVRAADEDAWWALAVDGPARLSSHYGHRSDPFSGADDFHHGVDLAAKTGTPILAIRPGVVTFSGEQRGYGRMVIVRHDDGLESVYAHASANLVSQGDRVDAGTPLARVGSTGRSTGPHLHFEMRRHGKPVDPLPHLERAARIQLARR